MGANTASSRLEAHFAGTFGRAAEGSWAAPGRVNLIGEYTDLNDGFVLPFATPQVTRVVAARRDDRALGVRSMQGEDAGAVELELGNPVSPKGWVAYPYAVARAIELYGFRLGGADLIVDSDVPVGAGLSSSAALECSVGMALCDLYEVPLTPMATALVSRRAENEFVGVPCGVMDQAASMCCTAGNVLLLDTRSLESRQVPFSPTAAGYSVVVVDTRVKHGLAESAYGERRASCERAAQALGVQALRDVPAEQSGQALERLAALGDEVLVRRARHVFTEQARVIEVVRRLDSGDVAGIGPLLFEGHASLRDDFEVSCDELDTVVEVARSVGAAGARLTGAGFGGSAIVLIGSGRADHLVDAVTAEFGVRGFTEPYCFTVEPSAGARRLW